MTTLTATRVAEIHRELEAIRQELLAASDQSHEATVLILDTSLGIKDAQAALGMLGNRLIADKPTDVLATAADMRARGATLYTVAIAVGRSKEWLRANGIS